MQQNKILLHICCAPCSSAAIRDLKENHEIILFFYNPNIHPFEEYEKRLSEARKISEKEKVNLIEADYEHEHFLSFAEPLASEKEGAKRCLLCYEDRLRKTASTAIDIGIPIFATTLTLSPHKDADCINEIGRRIGGELGVSYKDSNFKKKGGYNYSIEYSKANGLIRQDYCGCEFSRKSIASPNE